MVDALMLEDAARRPRGLSVNTSSGARSSHAHATPLTTDVTPGPSVVRQAPGWPEISACAMRRDRAGGLGRRQHERQTGAAGGVDQIEVAAAAGHAEERSRRRRRAGAGR